MGTTISANAIATVVSALTGLIAARALGPDARGAFAVGFAWFTLVSAIGEMGVLTTLTALVARFPHRLSALIAATSRVLWVPGVIGCAVLILVSFPLGNLDTDYRYLLLAWAAFTPVSFQVGIPIAALQATDPQAWNLARLVQPLSYGGIVLLLSVLGQLTLMLLVIGYAISALAAWLLSALMLARRGYGHAPWWVGRRRTIGATSDNADPTSVHRFTRLVGQLGLRTLPSLLPAAAAQRMTVVVLGLSLSADLVGQYAVALTVASLTLIAPLAHSYAAVSASARARGRPSDLDLAQTVRDSLKQTGLLAAGAALAIAAMAPFAVPTLLGPGYEQAGLLTSVLCLAQPGRALALTGTSLLRGCGLPQRALLPETVSLILLTFGLLLLIPIAGVWGAASAEVLASLALAGTMLRQLRPLAARRSLESH
jgi:O-antigen/teichoic acid export membrane protein